MTTRELTPCSKIKRSNRLQAFKTYDFHCVRLAAWLTPCSLFQRGDRLRLCLDVILEPGQGLQVHGQAKLKVLDLVLGCFLDGLEWA